MNRICIWVVLLLLIMPLVSCSDKTDEDFNSPTLKESLFLNLNIKTSSESATRADADGYNDDELEKGSFTENYIDIANNDFHIVLFNSSGDFLTEFKGEEVGSKKENNETANHLLEIEIKDDKLNGFPSNYASEEFTVVILTNWKAYSGKVYESFEGKNIKNIWTSSDFYELEYTGASGKSWYPILEENSKSLIPMIGIGKFTGFAYSSITGLPTASVTVAMLRSLAKITLSLKDDLWKSGFEIESCILNKFASKGKVIPDLSKEENTLGSDGSIHISVPWDTMDTEKSGPLSFVKVGAEGTNPILTAYVPEMNTAHYNTSKADRPRLTASLTLNNNQFKDNKDFELNDNNQGSTKLFHILRNHHYDFIIEDISENGEVELSYTVCPWVEGDTDIEFH